MEGSGVRLREGKITREEKGKDKIDTRYEERRLEALEGERRKQNEDKATKE